MLIPYIYYKFFTSVNDDFINYYMTTQNVTIYNLKSYIS